MSSEELNQLLFELTGEHITAKDFRTWGGTLAAFTYLKKRLDSERSAEKVVIEAVDEAAEALGNTRTVARAHYVHPHVLETYTEHTFGGYLDRAKPRPVRRPASGRAVAGRVPGRAVRRGVLAAVDPAAGRPSGRARWSCADPWGGWAG